MREDARETGYEIIELFGKPMLFTDLRIDRKTVPAGMYCYEVRHDDDCNGDPVEIAKNIMVNHWGTVITNEPIEEAEKDYLEIDPDEDWIYTGEECSLKRYMKEHPPEKQKEKDEER